jgi:hypothetical protein
MSLIKDIFFCLLVLTMTTTGQPTALRHPIVPRPEPEPTIITSEMVDCATSAGSVSYLVLFVTSGQYYKTTIVRLQSTIVLSLQSQINILKYTSIFLNVACIKFPKNFEYKQLYSYWFRISCTITDNFY